MEEFEEDVSKAIRLIPSSRHMEDSAKAVILVGPEYLGENTAIGCRIGCCKCENLVRSYHKFCSDCGAKLDRENVRKNENYNF